MAQKIGIVGGANFSKPSVKNLPDGFDNKTRVGFYIGGIVDIHITDYLSVQPGLNFSMKPGRIEFDNSSMGNGSSTINPFYIELPVNIVGKYKLGSGTLFANAGPYVAYGVAGKVKNETTYIGIKLEDNRNIKWGSDEMEDDIKPFDFGVNGGLGYQLKNGLFFNIGYQRGLTNMSVSDKDDDKTFTNMFRAGLGFMF